MLDEAWRRIVVNTNSLWESGVERFEKTEPCSGKKWGIYKCITVKCSLEKPKSLY